ncbi:MAG: serine O-acetyltransferase [Clostridia bacterium]|nr:serine O-acetyltransferase [Oscillospiraceae bacterium]MBQ2748425.1 serine O-acetyltransferase [Clostridia bacterium]MBQ4625403.1 serine O-acetyltransferase [Clostridia bacterium]MBR6762782.1 serine O-acetyltransferase [Clostridia bacterium]
MTPYQKLQKKGKKALQTIQKNISAIDYDVKKIMERDPAAVSYAQVLLLYPGLHAVMLHRGAHALFLQEKYFSARCLSQLSRFITGIEIHPGATIGRGLLIDHGMSVVIGETAEIGDDCTIYQGVTLGGTGKHVGKRHPTIGNNVMIGSGAKVLGPFRVGDNAKIAAGAVVLTEIPADATAVGVPAQVVRVAGKPLTEETDELDQIHIPDPVAQEFAKLEERLLRLEEALAHRKEEEV